MIGFGEGPCRLSFRGVEGSLSGKIPQCAV